MKLRIEVPQSRISTIKLGQIAKLTIDGIGGEVFTAIVRNIIPKASTASRNFPVQLEVDNSQGKIPTGGVFARVNLQEERTAVVDPLGPATTSQVRSCTALSPSVDARPRSSALDRPFFRRTRCE